MTLSKCADGAWQSPGFTDIQVNGFAGADYNSPRTTLDEIARSLRALFSTGVTQLLPTVITGSPEDMLGALTDLARSMKEAGKPVRRALLAALAARVRARGAARGAGCRCICRR